MKLSRVLIVQVHLLLQLNDLSGGKVGEHPVVTNQSLDVVETLLEATPSVNSNVLLSSARRGPLELVVDVDGLSENVAAGDTQNLIASVAALVFTFMEVKSEAALSVFGLPLLSSEGNVESRSENAADMGGRMEAAHNMHKGWTRQLRRNGLAPFYRGILDSVLDEKCKDMLGYLVSRTSSYC